VNIYTCLDESDDTSCTLQVNQYELIDSTPVKPTPDNIEIDYKSLLEDPDTYKKVNKSVTMNFYPTFAKKVIIEMYGFNVIAKIKNFLAQSGENSLKTLGYIAIKYIECFNNYIDIMIKSNYLNSINEKCIIIPRKKSK